jgi:ribA/ribD-fused uncharacterized protein
MKRTTDKMYFFHGYQNPLSNWHKCNFKVKGLLFNCMEQYMMYCKAMVFRDYITAALIYKSSSPKEQKALGRIVKNFDEETWVDKREAIVRRGLLSKFDQNRELKEFLLITGHATIVEASPSDCIWGVGLRESDPLIHDPANWRGMNLLGKLLMEVRNELRSAHRQIYY